MRPTFSKGCRQLPIAAAAAALCSVLSLPAGASSHREAPSIAMNPSVDATDFYMFRSYEGVAGDGTGGRSGFVTMLANYIPFQDPQGGPNFYMFNPNALYEIHVDNNGDGVEDLTFQFRFNNTSKGTTLPIGGKNVQIPLINSGQITGVNPPTLDVRESFTLGVVRGLRRSAAGTLATNAGPGTSNGTSTFDKPVDNIGQKTIPDYAAYAAQHIYTVNIPGCTTGGVQQTGRVFVGQRKEPFYIAVGKIFDLINLNPLGPEVGGNNNDLESKSVSTLALEVPISCLTSGTEPVIGAWTTASLRQARLLNGYNLGSLSNVSGRNRATKEGGAWTQVSRLSMPLVNELVIGTNDKDRFNASRPKDDAANFADYVTNPTFPALVQTLFPSAPAPTNFPRTDLIAAFLTGLPTVNRSSNTGRVLSEMMRLNTSLAAKPVAAQNALGVAAGDTAGFPNGRRPADDVVDVTLRVAMGALCVLTGPTDALQVGCKPSDAPAGGAALTDGVRKTAINYGATFPYLTTPLPGNFNPAPAAGTTFP